MNTTIFKAYNSIDNVELKKAVEQIISHNYNDNSIIYRCSEKVDGANASLYVYPDNTIKYGSRTQFIDVYSFMGFDRAIRNDNLNEKAIEIRNILLKDKIIAENHVIVIYGELYGGYYGHPLVTKCPGAKRIQKRVDYAPDNYFYVFDIRIMSDEYTKYLDDDTVINVCDMVKMPREVILFEGTFDECMNYKNDGLSQVAVKLHELPQIDNNIMEGVVIKPIYPLYYGNERVILKNKNEKFKERMKHKNKNKVKQLKTDIQLTIDEQKYVNILEEYITESRLCSVVSKIGKLTQKDFGKLLGLFVKDIIDDFNKEYLDEITLLERKTTIDEFSWKNVKISLQKTVTEWIRPYFINLLNE